MHFGKPVIFGFDCAVAVLAMVALSFYWLSHRHDLSSTQRATRLGMTLLALLFFLQGLVLSQSRGVWLALLVALPVVVIVLWRGLGKAHAVQTKTWVLMGFVALFAVMLTITLNWKTVTERLASERGVYCGSQ